MFEEKKCGFINCNIAKFGHFNCLKVQVIQKNKNVSKEYSHLIHSVDLIAGIDFIQSNSVVKAGTQSLSLL